MLTAAEQHLVTTLQAEKGRDLLKQVRSQLLEIARPVLEAMVLDVTGVKTLSMHHDISTVRGRCNRIAAFLRCVDPPLACGSDMWVLLKALIP